MKPTKGKRAVRTDKKEPLKPVEDRNLGKRKAEPKAENASKKRDTKGKPAKKDPDMPKRPSTAFFVFLEDFRKTYKKEHPNVKGVSAVGKAGGSKWKSMSAEVLGWPLALWLDSGPRYALGMSSLMMFGMDSWGTGEKAPYEAKAAKRKLEYEQLMKAYNAKEESKDDDEDSEASAKSKSEASDEDEEESEEEDEEED